MEAVAQRFMEPLAHTLLLLRLRRGFGNQASESIKVTMRTLDLQQYFELPGRSLPNGRHQSGNHPEFKSGALGPPH